MKNETVNAPLSLRIISFLLGRAIWLAQKLSIIPLGILFLMSKVMSFVDGIIYDVSGGRLGEENWERTPEGREIAKKITEDSFKMY